MSKKKRILLQFPSGLISPHFLQKGHRMQTFVIFVKLKLFILQKSGLEYFSDFFHIYFLANEFFWK